MNYGRIIRITFSAIAAYLAVVVVFESLLGYFQPAGGATQTITTFDASGEPHVRVVARLESAGELYVAANHWPRDWYSQALANPRMEVIYEDEVDEYRVVPLPEDSDEYARVDSEHRLGPVFRFLTGFPPRRLLRLEPL